MHSTERQHQSSSPYHHEDVETINDQRKEPHKKHHRITYHQIIPYYRSKQKPRHHHHHHHHRRRRHHHHRHGHSHDYPHHHHDSCPRKPRSNTDLSSTSINTCHESCTDHEVREILIKRPCCSTSKTELVQYLAKDLYGTMQRSSCCTSSEYCYHTDSTSLYGSRSTLSRNNSIKSASASLRRKRTRHRESSYNSISLGRLNGSNPYRLGGSLTSIFNKPCDSISRKMILSPSKITIEHQSKNSINKTLPEYACSPSPIRWSFLADSENKTPSDFNGTTVIESHSDKTKKSEERSRQNCEDFVRNVDQEESTTIIFHQEGEAFNNCCNNYLQCNAFLDQDLQITSADICEYLSRGKQEEVLNNSVDFPLQSSNTSQFHYKNNFTISNNSQEVRKNSIKETNLNQNNTEVQPAINTTMSPTNINLSPSSNNINIIFNSYLENNANEVKFINTSRDNDVSIEHHHSASLSLQPSNTSNNSFFNKPLGIDEILPSNHTPERSLSLLTESIQSSASNYNLLYHHYTFTTDHNIELLPCSFSPSLHRQAHCTHHRWQHITRNFKFSNTLRKVHKRARKYTQFLHKK